MAKSRYTKTMRDEDLRQERTCDEDLLEAYLMRKEALAKIRRARRGDVGECAQAAMALVAAADAAGRVWGRCGRIEALREVRKAHLLASTIGTKYKCW